MRKKQKLISRASNGDHNIALQIKIIERLKQNVNNEQVAT